MAVRDFLDKVFNKDEEVQIERKPVDELLCDIDAVSVQVRLIAEENIRLQERIAELEREKQHVCDENCRVHDHVCQLNDEIAKLEEEKQHVCDEKCKVNDHVCELEDKIAKLEEEKENVCKDNVKEKERNDELLKEIDRLKDILYEIGILARNK